MAPSGYTAVLYDGEQSFEDFVMRCARGMGALIDMRDEPLDAPLRMPQERNSYDQRRIDEEQARIKQLLAMTVGELDKEQREKIQVYEQQYRDSALRVHQLRLRYERMAEAVKAWKPPSNDHEGLKEFMLIQLSESLDFDCRGWARTPPVMLEAEEYRTQQLGFARSAIDQAAKHMEEERERVRARREWIAALQQSLGIGGSDET